MVQNPFDEANTSNFHTQKQSMYFNVKFYKKDNELHEIYFSV